MLSNHNHVLLKRDNDINTEEQPQKQQKELYHQNYTIKEQGNSVVAVEQQQQTESPLVQETNNLKRSLSDDSLDSINDNNNAFDCSNTSLLTPFISSSNNGKTKFSSMLLFLYIVCISLVLAFTNTISLVIKKGIKSETKPKPNDPIHNDIIKNDIPKNRLTNKIILERKSKWDLKKPKPMEKIPYYFNLFDKKHRSTKSIKSISRSGRIDGDQDRLVVLDVSGLSKCYDWKCLYFGSETTSYNRWKGDNNVEIITVDSLCSIWKKLNAPDAKTVNNKKKARLLVIVDNPIDRTKQFIPKERNLLLSKRLFTNKVSKHHTDNVLIRSILCKRNKVTDSDYDLMDKIFNKYANYISSDDIMKLQQKKVSGMKKRQSQYVVNDCLPNYRETNKIRASDVTNIIRKNHFDYKLYSHVNQMSTIKKWNRY